jgi:hypothetical protein
MISRLAWSVALAAAVLSPRAVGGEALDVPLTVHDAAGAERRGEPCSTGVPLPPGALSEPEGVAVYGPSGRAVPAQFRVLERWREKASGRDDGSIKWLLVTFLADVSKGGESEYRLKPGTNPAPAAPVTLDKKGDGYELGGLPISSDFSAPFDLVLTDADGKEIHASELPVKLTVCEQGPVRACLRAESVTVPGKFGFTAWVYAYAGLKRWDLTVTLNNTPREVQGPLYLKDFSVVWAPVGLEGATAGLLGGEPGKSVGVDAPAWLYQASDGTEQWSTMEKWRSEFVMDWSQDKKLRAAGVPSFRGYKVTNGSGEQAKGNSALGWAALNGGGRGALACVRHFKQNYPKAVELGAGRLVVRLWPKYYKGYDGLQWLDDATRKDHDISFVLADGAIDAATGETAARAFDARLVAHCGPDWYRKAGVFSPGGRRYPYKLTGPDPKTWSRIQNRNWVTFGGDVTDRIRRRYHGYTREPFLGTGDPYHAYVLAAYARHSSGMTPLWADEYQYPRDIKMFTHAQYCGTARKTGSYRPGTGHHGYKTWNDAHFVCDEIFDGWRLLGDPVAGEGLKGVAVYSMAWVDFRENGGGLVAGTRADGLPFFNLCESYRITGDEKMLEVMRRMADVSWKQVNKHRGNYGVMKSWEGGQDRCEKPFMMCQVVKGLRAYYQLTADERALDQILGMLDFILQEATIGDRGWTYVVKLDPGAQEPYRKTSLQKAREKKATSYTHLSPYFAWLHKHTGEPRFRQVIDGIDPKPYPHTSRKYTCYYPERTDQHPPPAVTDLAAEPLGGGKVKLTWTTPGDAAKIQLKWSERPMLERIDWQKQAETHANWWAAHNVANEPPAQAGSQSVVVEGVSPGRRHFALRAWDAASNRGPMSNQVAADVK